MTYEQSEGEYTPPGEARSHPTRTARLAIRWRNSLALRVTTGVVVALLICGIGFAAGTAFDAGDSNRNSRHEVTADHPFWEDRMGWIHRHAHEMSQHLHLAPGSPSTTAAHPSADR